MAKQVAGYTFDPKSSSYLKDGEEGLASASYGRPTYGSAYTPPAPLGDLNHPGPAKPSTENWQGKNPDPATAPVAPPATPPAAAPPTAAPVSTIPSAPPPAPGGAGWAVTGPGALNPNLGKEIPRASMQALSALAAKGAY